MPPLKSYWRPGTWLVLAAIVLGLLFGARPLAAQTGTVEGAVTVAATGEPIAGAEVTVSGTNLGTRTGPDGRFSLLNVPEGFRDIRVLAIGYKVATLKVTILADQTTQANVALTTSVLQLDAVVVTGTAGQARVREVGNSIAQVNLSQVKDPPANMDQLLQARAPGLSVMQTSGMAGEGAQIRLRGAVSVSQSNQPIVYVDGVRVRSEGYRRNRPPFNDSNGFRGANYQASPLNDVNPADVDRVEIIKGAAASTLYGTEAAAGVIQIFTKKGAGGATRWTFETAQGYAQLRPFGTDSVPYLNLRPAGAVNGLCHEAPATGCSWIRNAYRERYSGSVAGGSTGGRGIQYFLSATSEDNDGVLPLDNEKKFSTRGNLGLTLSDNLKVDWNTAYSNTDLSNTPAGNNAHGLVLNVYRAERNYRSSSDPVVIDSLLNQSITTGINHLVSGATATYTPLPWFSNRFTIGYDLAQQENRNVRPFGFVAAPQGIIVDEQVRYSLLTADYVGNMNFRLSPELASTFSVGGQGVTSEEVRTTAYGENFPGPGPLVVTNGSVLLASEARIRVINAGFFFQNVFKLRDRYFLTGGVRLDGNTAFGRSLGLQAYPKISGSYVISDEPFWPAGWGEVKLRGALGWAGRAPGAFDQVRSWRPCAIAGISCLLPGQVGDTLIGPERTREAELGFDAALFGNRVTLEATWYHRLTTEALFAVRQVPSGGFSFDQRSNVGQMSNTGIELAANATVLNKPDWGVDVGGSVYTNHGLVRNLGGAVAFAAGGGWVEVGFPPMAARGVIINNPNAIAAPDTVCRSSCTSDGMHIFGPQQPTLILGQQLNVRMPKGITLSARGEYQGGAWIQDGASFNALSRSVRWPTCARAYPILYPGGPTDSLHNANIPQLTARERKECVPTNTNVDTFWFPQDFWKLRDVTLTIPVGWAIRRVSSATLAITVQNYFKWINSQLRLFDPEMVGRDALDSQNRDISEHIPPPAVITFNLRMTF
ncbi:MAG TPA: TonB-dependent receptor [Gemmatimonadales bacterium]|jgi:outer membrane receptor protein involved in Fe transport